MSGHQHGHNEHANETTSLMSKDNGHDHSHSHGHNSQDNDTHKKTSTDPVLQRLKLATGLCFTFMMVEIVGGLLAGSLAVLSDAAHLTADLASFAVAIFAAYLAAKPSTEFHTYGLKRTESLAALFSMTTLALISIGLALEACRRIYHMTMDNGEGREDDDQVDGKLMSLIATIGVLVNVALAAVLGSEGHVHMPGAGGHDHDHGHGDHQGGHDHSHGDHLVDNNNHHDEENHIRRSGSHLHSDEVVPLPVESSDKPRNVNLQAAYLHVMADLAQSVAVLIAGLIIWWKPEWKIVDPIATILFCILVFYSTLGVIRSAVSVMLEAVPPNVSWQTVYSEIEATSGVLEVHDLHIWSISHGANALSVHVHANIVEKDDNINNATTAAINSNRILAEIASVAKRNGIQHPTIQIQPTPTAITDGINHYTDACITCRMSDQSTSCV